VGKGSSENLNELIRQFTLKKTDFSQITDKSVQQVQDTLKTPKKI
jgi:IS30 family transposase